MDIDERIIDKLDILDEKIDKLCIWKTEMDSNWKHHLEDMEKAQNKKLRSRDFVIVIFGLGIAALEAFRSLGVI